MPAGRELELAGAMIPAYVHEVTDGDGTVWYRDDESIDAWYADPPDLGAVTSSTLAEIGGLTWDED